ncbi:MAG: hypothetical protein JSV58_01615 [Candidatus Bathyarchaeota archaeon]|nr:MAG: hypothetical protein JSV58_01615 [Candidatus Bathyarchaeota archaeon]
MGKDLTVKEIASYTGIPRSTVGYFVRKFNKLAAEGKPIVFLGPPSPIRKSPPSPLAIINLTHLTEIAGGLLEKGDIQRLYCLLRSLKLMSEFGIVPKPSSFKRALDSLS